nr:alanine racemase [Kocuria subflava]
MIPQAEFFARLDSALDRALDHPDSATSPQRASDAPVAVVDLDALDSNADDLVRRAGSVPIRVASKSVRCTAILRRVLQRPGFHGILAYSLAEAIHLVRTGVSDDVVVAYPTAQRTALKELAADPDLAHAITLMVDHPDQLAWPNSHTPGAQYHHSPVPGHGLFPTRGSCSSGRPALAVADTGACPLRRRTHCPAEHPGTSLSAGGGDGLRSPDRRHDRLLPGRPPDEKSLGAGGRQAPGRRGGRRPRVRRFPAPRSDARVVEQAMDQLERGGRVSFGATRHRQFFTLILLVMVAVLFGALVVAVVIGSGGFQTATREPALWLALVIATASCMACEPAVLKTRTRHRLVITQGGFFQETRTSAGRRTMPMVRWMDVNEIWIRWIGVFRPSASTMLACYTLTPEAELTSRRRFGERMEAMRRTDSASGDEVHALPISCGARQIDVVEVMRRAHVIYGPSAWQDPHLVRP